MGRRIFTLLVRLLPGEFRGDFGDAMMADSEATGTNWWRENTGVIRAIVREHADQFRQDLSYAVRMMRRTPGFTLTAVVMLALGTGVNAAMFSVVDAVMIHSPFRDPGRLAFVRVAEPDGSLSLVPADRLRGLESSPAIERLATFGGGQHVMTAPGEPRLLDNIECVSASMFDVLGTAPAFGRTFAASEDVPGAPPAVVLSHTFWKELGGSPSILGTALTINQTPVTVIGVMPKGFYGAQARANTLGWLPYANPIRSADNTGCRASAAASVVVRLRSGLTRAQAAERSPGFAFEAAESVWMDTVRTPLRVLTVAVACVLLIACFNVGGLQMERTLARRRELSLRLALGASRGRVARQIVTESVLFALVGALAGVAAAAATLSGLVSILPPNTPYLAEISINARVLAVTVGVATMAGLLCGVFPLLETKRFSATKGAGAFGRTTESRGWLRRGLVVGEIALSIMVVIAAGLMIQTFNTLKPTNPGFDPDHKLWQPIRLRGATPEASAEFFERLLNRLRNAPGIRRATATTYVPMVGLSGIGQIVQSGSPIRALTNEVQPDFFESMRIPIVAGRAFTSEDRRGSPPVAIVNETAARKIRPDGRVVGERISLKADGLGLTDVTIVGVIADTRGSGIDTRARTEAYLPYAQNPGPSLTLIVDYAPGQAASAAETIRRAVRELRPDLVIAAPSELRGMIDKQVATPRFGAWLLGIFAGLALLLASVGLMTTIGWWVGQRQRELGVRIALGATRAQIVRLVGGQGMALAALGIVVGSAGAAGLTRYMSSFIYGVSAGDAATFAGTAVAMLAVAGLAIHLPVRRATRIDPATTLRAE